MSALLEVLLMVSGLSVLATVHFTQMAFSSSFTGVVTADNANYSTISIKYTKDRSKYVCLLVGPLLPTLLENLANARKFRKC